MALNVTDSGSGGFEPEAGIHNVVCSGIIDVGTTTDPTYNKTRHQAIIRFSFSEITIEGDNSEYNPTFGQFYTLSLHPKANLRKHLEGWRGKAFSKEELEGFDLQNVLGKPCTLVIGRTESGKAVIESITKPMVAHELHDEAEWFSYEEFEGAFPEWMSDNMQKFCMKAQEYQSYLTVTGGAAEEHAAPETDPDLDSEIPF